MANARSELTRAGLITLSVPTSTAVSMKAGSKPGLQEVTVTLKQTGTAASLPLPPVSSLPPGFTAVNVFPDTANPSNVTREFTYVENVSTIAPIGSSSVAFPPARGLTSVDAQTEARKVLASTNLLSTPPSVKTTPLTQYVSLTPTSGGIPPGGYHIVIFEQTGPASALPAVVSPVPGVRVVVLPGSGGTVTRIVSVVDAGLINALFSAASSASGPAVAAQATNVARVELQRSGFFRTQPGVTQNPPSTRNSGAAGAAAPDRIIFTETGPANLLPEPPSHVLPTGVTCSVTAGAIPGEVSRNFVVNIPGFLAAGGAVGAAPARPGTVAVSRGSGAMPGPSMLAIDVMGPGVPRAGRAMFPNAINNAAMAPLATTPALEQVVRGKFSSSGSRSPPNIVGFEPMQVPADWRIWSSFNSVLLTTGDFDGLDGARRSALRTWIASGGVLFLSPEAAGDSRTERVGAGRIETLAEPISEVTASDIFTRLQLSGLAPGMPDRERVSFTVGSAMEDMVKFEPVDTLWLSLFLIVFAVLIGPVNLYWLAPTTKRHRLFLTTPLLSIAGAAGVAVAIVLQDGLGGDGLRRALVVLVPGESQAVIFQEQAARSGFLTQREFALDDAVLCAVLPVDGNIYTSGPAGRAFAREQGRAAGDWFGNRARQAHLLRGLAPTRARIELVGTAADGAPTIESTLSTELRDFRLRDADGRTWSASSVPTGRRITLRADGTNSPGTNSNYNGTPNLISLLKDAGTLTEPWQWVANGSGTELAPIVTLRAIRWKDDPIVYAGFAERPGASSRSAAPAAPSTATKGGQ
jgi:hypothetical protein